jgi:murein DD-endopeptidase MepM/ murein hydrolase activator NlpD
MVRSQLVRIGGGSPRLSAAVGCVMLAVLTLPTGMVSPAAGVTDSAHWVWPLAPTPEAVNAFDPPDEPWLPGHRGVDLAGDPDQVVHAAGAGQVTFAGQIAGLGVIVLDHGALRTTYEPVHPTVGVGDMVAAGDVIGRLKTAGGHCLPATCLHWGLLRGDTYLNPLLLVGGGPVRLLPVSGLGLAPAPTLTDPARGGSGPSIPDTTSGTAPSSASMSNDPAAAGTGQASRSEPGTPHAPRTRPRSDDPSGGWWPWQTGWIVLSAVGAGLSLRAPIRRALSRADR